MDHEEKLTSEEMKFCESLGLDVGFDDDDETKHQWCHVCWPYESHEGALCRSKRLWFQGNALDVDITRIDCIECMKEVRRLRAVQEPALFAALGKTVAMNRALNVVESVTETYVSMLDMSRDAAEKFHGTIHATATLSAVRTAIKSFYELHVRLSQERDERRAAEATDGAERSDRDA